MPRAWARGPQRWKVLVTAGPTREHLDDVRFLSNASTGRMGILLAREAARRGAAVTLVLGPSSERRPPGVEIVDVVSTREMLDATREAARGADLVFFAAAPSDWRPLRRRKGKPAREGDGFTLALRPTEDVAATLGRRKGKRVHVGFALEVDGGERRARAKMARKRFDAIVLNTPANFGPGGGEIRWIPRWGETGSLPASSKRATARAIVSRSLALVSPSAG
ncbi:MAG: phosphopantothenoylcysteine decarboxylase [Planctomycetota bacterium]